MLLAWLVGKVAKLEVVPKPVEKADVKYLNEVDEQTSDAKALTNYLIALNSNLINTLMKTFDLANKSNQQGIANFIAERIDMHQKWNWFLKASGK